MKINDLNDINEVEMNKILLLITKVSESRNIEGVDLEFTPQYKSNKPHDYILKTHKVYQDLFLKLKFTYA